MRNPTNLYEAKDKMEEGLFDVVQLDEVNMMDNHDTALPHSMGIAIDEPNLSTLLNVTNDQVNNMIHTKSDSESQQAKKGGLFGWLSIGKRTKRKQADTKTLSSSSNNPDAAPKKTTSKKSKSATSTLPVMGLSYSANAS